MTATDYREDKKDISRVFFYVPVTGIITNPFNAENEHYGVDIVAPADEPILASLKGTVILSTWTLGTGNIIQIQHENDIITVYKHNSMLLKKSGDFVKAGEPIAVIGNSGELSTGPHLHFELWYKGIPVNPEKYIKF